MPCDIFGLGSSPFARHYLGNHYLFSLPAGTKMFQFPAFAFVTYCHKCRRFAPAGFPIRISTLQRLLAPQRGFSQLVTSFFAYESLGIHHTPFLFVIRLSSLTYTFRYISERKHTSAVFSLRLLMICFLAFACGSLLRVRIACINMSYIASPLRSPQGRSPKDSILAEIVENNGFEPLTLCLQSRCSSQLS